jgi:hypothetical protein
LILTKDGATHEVVEEVIAGIEAAEKRDLLPITKLLASLVFTSESDKEWIIWRFNKMSDILRETWAYQEIVQEGELRVLHQALLDVVQARFPEILPYTKKQTEGIEDAGDLETLDRENEHSADSRRSSTVPLHDRQTVLMPVIMWLRLSL